MSTVRTRIIARAFSMQGGIVVVVALFGCVRLSVCLSGRLSVMWCVCEAGTGAGPESSRATLLHTYMPRTCTYRSHRARRTPPAQPCCQSPDGYCGLGRLLRCKAQRQRLSMHARLYTCQHHLAYPKSQKAPAHGAGSCSYVLEQESGASSVAVARIIRPVSRFCAVWEVWWRAEEADSRLGCRKRSPLV